MNLPTKITITRLVLIPVFIALFLIPFPYHQFAATAVFIIASLTDWLDGHLARKYNMVTTLGKFLDPVADKVLVASALILATTLGVGNAYKIAIVVCSVVIIARELIITCFRTIAATKNVILAADKIGKAKTATQLTGLTFYLPFEAVTQLNEIAGKVFFYIDFAPIILLPTAEWMEYAKSIGVEPLGRLTTSPFGVNTNISSSNKSIFSGRKNSSRSSASFSVSSSVRIH